MMLNFELIAQFLHHIVIQICTIISDDLARNPIETNDIILDETDHHLLGDVSIRSCFNLLGEVTNGHEYETMFVGSFWFNLADHINAPHRKGPWRRDDIER